MEHIWDCIVVGGGPAGLSAALNLRRRGRTVLVLSGGAPLLEKAELVENYLGMPGVTGQEMMERFRAHALAQGAEICPQRVGNVIPMGETFLVGAGSEMYTARAVILACGVSKAAQVPGEAEFLGRGVSYCATCDGMLYRQKHVAVWGLSPEAPEEAEFLHSIGCQVTYIAPKRPQALAPGIEFLPGAVTAVHGGAAVTSVEVKGEALAVDGLFILRPSAPPDSLVPGIGMENGRVKVDDAMRTNIPRLYAAGDMLGAPLQVAKAVGDGLVAGLCAAEELQQLEREATV